MTNSGAMQVWMDQLVLFQILHQLAEHYLLHDLRWSMMESNVWNESRIVLNCLLWWIMVQTKGSLYTAHGRYGLVLHTCTVEPADGWNALTAVQRWTPIGGSFTFHSTISILSAMLAVAVCSVVLFVVTEAILSLIPVCISTFICEDKG